MKTTLLGLLAAIIITCACLASCVTTTAPDGTKTTSFAPSVEQLEAAADLASSLRKDSGK